MFEALKNPFRRSSLAGEVDATYMKTASDFEKMQQIQQEVERNAMMGNATRGLSAGTAINSISTNPGTNVGMNAGSYAAPYIPQYSTVPAGGYVQSARGGGPFMPTGSAQTIFRTSPLSVDATASCAVHEDKLAVHIRGAIRFDTDYETQETTGLFYMQPEDAVKLAKEILRANNALQGD